MSMPGAWSVSRQLSQQEIDAAFQNLQGRKREAPAVKFDFRRPDRIPKSQVRAIHLLHDTFVRNLVSSSSAYLRSYLTVNLVSVEQLSYAEFLDGLPSPTASFLSDSARTMATGYWNSTPAWSFPSSRCCWVVPGRARRRSSVTLRKSSSACWTACSASFCRICGRPGKRSPTWISPSKVWRPSRSCCICWHPTKRWYPSASRCASARQWG